MTATAQDLTLDRSTGDAPREAPRWLFPSALAAATALAAILALWHLGHHAFVRDEVATVTDAHRSLSSWFDVMIAREANMWPYYLLMNGWTHLGGTGETWVRLPGALAAIASVPAAMLLARRLFGDVAGAVTGVAFALLPMLMEIAQEARAYTFILPLVVASAWLLVSAVERPRLGAWIAWGAVAGFCVHLHMLAALVVLAQASSILLLPRGAVPARFLRAGALTFAVVISPMVVYAATSDSGQTSWIPSLSPKQVGSAGGHIAGTTVAGLAIGVLAVAAVVALYAQVRRDGRSADAWRQGLILAWVALPPAALLVLSVVKPLYEAAYLSGVLPGVALLIGMVAARGPALHRLALPAVGVTFAVLVAGQLTHPHPEDTIEDLRGAAQYVAANTQPGDGVAYSPGFARVGFKWYLDKTPAAGRLADLDAKPGRGPLQTGDLFGDELPAAQVARNLEGARRVWLVGYPGDPWHPTAEPVVAVAPRILRDSFVRVGTRDWGQMVVTLYRHK